MWALWKTFYLNIYEKEIDTNFSNYIQCIIKLLVILILFQGVYHLYLKEQELRLFFQLQGDLSHRGSWIMPKSDIVKFLVLNFVFWTAQIKKKLNNSWLFIEKCYTLSNNSFTILIAFPLIFMMSFYLNID